jgi:hypothetical protein
MRKPIPKFQLRENLGEILESGRPVSQLELIKLTGRMAGQTQLLTPALAGAETEGSFAHIYAQGDPKVLAPGKPWSNS